MAFAVLCASLCQNVLQTRRSNFYFLMKKKSGFYSTLCIPLSKRSPGSAYSNTARKGEMSAIGWYFCGIQLKLYSSDVWLSVRRNSVWIRKTSWMSLFVFFISLLIVAQHVSGNHVPIIRR